MKKNLQRAVSLMLCAVTVCLLLCGVLPVMAAEIGTVAVTVTAPSAGASPSFQATAADSRYSADQVQWLAPDGTALSTGSRFEAGKTYQVQVTLSAATGEVFQEGVSGTVNGNGCRVEKVNSAIKLIYDFTVSSPVINRVSVGDLSEPAQGAAPDIEFSVADRTYRIQEVVWTHVNAPGGAKVMDDTTPFTGGGQYKIRIVLAAEAGCSFDASVSGTINGKTVSCTSAGNGMVALENTYTVTQSQEISQVSVTGLSLPAEGLQPDFTVSVPADALYTIDEVAWRGWVTAQGSSSYHTLTPDSTFMPGRTYQVAIVLRAKPGAVFRLNEQGKPQVTATIDGETVQDAMAITTESPAAYVVIGAVYPLAGDKTPVSQVTVTEITPPSIGKKPVSTAKVPEDALYTVDKVIWKRWNNAQSLTEPVNMGSQEKFMQNTDYRVDVILKAKDEAAFTLDTFDRPLVSATLNENPTNPPTAVPNQDPAQYICVSYHFRTATDLIESVSILGLDEPVKGKHTDSELSLPGDALYEIESVIWQWRDPQTPNSKFAKMTFSDVFEYDKEYQICVTLIAKEDAEFSTNSEGQPQVTVKFNNEPAKPAAAVKDRESAQCIQVTYEFLLESDIKTIDQVEVHDLEMPKPGSTPDKEASVSFVAKYTVNSIAWERMENGKASKLKNSDKFRAGETYRVTVVLQAKENAIFAVSTVGKHQVAATIDAKTVSVSAASGRDPEEYIALVREFTIYTVVEGEGAIWTPDKETLRFRFSGERRDFKHLEVDGVLVDARYYTVADNDVVIQLSSSFISALKDKEYTLKAVFTDGEATLQFQVDHNANNSTTPQKKSNPVIWILITAALVLLTAGGIAIYIFLYKKGWV